MTPAPKPLREPRTIRQSLRRTRMSTQNRQGRKADGQCTFCRSFRAHLDGCPALQDDLRGIHSPTCPVAGDEYALCRCHVIEESFAGAHS